MSLRADYRKRRYLTATYSQEPCTTIQVIEPDQRLDSRDLAGTQPCSETPAESNEQRESWARSPSHITNYMLVYGTPGRVR